MRCCVEPVAPSRRPGGSRPHGAPGTGERVSVDTQREAIFRHIDAHLEEHVERMRRWVRQPSVSWHHDGVAACAALVADELRDLGCAEVELIEGRFHPGVWAHYDAGAPVTIHTYCMFDTRTADPAAWSVDPWGAELVATERYPRVLMGRGAMGAKGPFVAFLNALRSIVATEGTLPVNVMFLAEGEEIMGSPSYRGFVERYRDRLATVDASYCVSSSQSPAGAVSVGLGLKGMVVLELTASGETWPAAPARTIHSAAAGLVASPPFRLAQALATLTEPDGTGCAVDGLREAWVQRVALSDDERALLESIAARFAGKDWRDALPLGGAGNVGALVGGSEGDEPLLRYLYGPTFNVAGMRAGFLGPHTGTIPFIVPGSATATIDARMVVPMPADEIVAAMRRHLDAHGFDDVRIDVLSAFDHQRTPPSHPAVGALTATLDAWGLERQVWPMQPGGGPWTVVPNAFGVPCLRGGAPGHGVGGNDEYFVIEGDGRVAGLADVEKFHVDALFNVAGALAGRG